MTDKIRIVLADDHTVLRAGLVMLLNSQPDLEVVGQAADGKEAEDMARNIKPDIILMDIAMPGMSGIEATERVKEVSPATKVLVLTMHDDEGYLRQVIKAGASGYVLKKAADTELMAAIRAVSQGEMYVYPTLASAVLRGMLEKEDNPSDEKNLLKTLSEREREVLQLIALGYTNQEIGDKIIISVKTVETYKTRLMDKLNLRRRSELVRFAMESGLIPKVES